MEELTEKNKKNEATSLLTVNEATNHPFLNEPKTLMGTSQLNKIKFSAFRDAHCAEWPVLGRAQQPEAGAKLFTKPTMQASMQCNL